MGQGVGNGNRPLKEQVLTGPREEWWGCEKPDISLKKRREEKEKLNISYIRTHWLVSYFILKLCYILIDHPSFCWL